MMECVPGTCARPMFPSCLMQGKERPIGENKAERTNTIFTHEGA
jgi:hypothetical protein